MRILIIFLISLFTAIALSANHVCAQEQLLYNTVAEKGVSNEIAFVLKRVYTVDEKAPCAACLEACDEPWVQTCKEESAVSCQPKTILIVSILSTGKGIQFRNWLADKVTLILNDTKIKPCAQDKFYVPKESVLKDAATVVFVAIGSQYEQDASHAKNSPGTSSCSGSSTEGTKHTRGKTAKAIDRAGMAIGLGLLQSQAKGEITGLRACFDVTGLEEHLHNGRLEAKVNNNKEHKKVRVNIPVQFEWAELTTLSDSLSAATIDTEEH